MIADGVNAVRMARVSRGRSLVGISEHGASFMLHERQTLALDELSEPDRPFGVRGRWRLPQFSQTTLHVSGLFLATGVLAFDLSMPPRMAAALVYLFVLLLSLRRSLGVTRRFLQCTLECLDSHVAVLDERGRILAVNSTWNPFGKVPSAVGESYGPGANYLHVCEKAGSKDSPEPWQIASGIRDLFAQRGPAFRLDLLDRTTPGGRWLAVRATRFEQDGKVRIVVEHRDITSRRSSELKLDAANQPADASGSEAAKLKMADAPA
jgi:PAS domain-containing protein